MSPSTIYWRCVRELRVYGIELPLLLESVFWGALKNRKEYPTLYKLERSSWKTPASLHLYQVCMETHWCYPLGCDVGVSEGEVVVLGIYHTEVLGHLSARVLELCLLQVWLQSTAGTYNHVRSSVFPCLQEPGDEAGWPRKLGNGDILAGVVEQLQGTERSSGGLPSCTALVCSPPSKLTLVDPYSSGVHCGAGLESGLVSVPL
jgi:hypothetical protein